MTLIQKIRRKPLFQFTIGGFRWFFREPDALGWAFAFPLLVTVCMSLAFGGDAKNDSFVLGVAEAEHVDAAWLTALRADPGIRVVLLPSGPGSAADAQSPVSEALSTAATSALFAREHLDVLLTPAGIVTTGVGGESDPFVTKLRAVHDSLRTTTLSVTKTQVPGIRWIEWFIPGMIGLQMLSRGLNGCALQLAQDRSRGYLKRLQLSPFRKADYLLGFSFGRAAIVLLEVMVLLLVYRLAYHFDIQGSKLVFVGIAVLGAVCCSLLGIAATSRLVNHEAAAGVVSALFFPSMFASGVYFKIEKFPVWIRHVIESLPLGALNQALRLVANTGASSSEVLRPILVLLAWGTVSLVVAIRFFKWDPREA